MVVLHKLFSITHTVLFLILSKVVVVVVMMMG
jgi:hypothetical protein